MKQVLKLLITLLSFTTLVSTVSLAEENWAPIVMNDIVTFVPYVAENEPVKPIKTLQEIYNADDTVSVVVNTQLSGDQDWVGVYKKGDSSDWENVIAWNWVGQQGTIVLDSDKKPMPAGEYEVRLFFHNSTSDADIVARYTFTVEGIAREFGTVGPYADDVLSTKTIQDDKVINAIYYVEGEADLPTVIFMGGWHVDLIKYDGLLEYITSLGFCVVAQIEDDNYSTPNVHAERLTTLLNTAHNDHAADLSKLGVIGHSSGGGIVFYLMDYFQSNNIAGQTKSVVMSLDGWFPFKSTIAGLNAFDSPTLLMQFGGLDGINKEGTHPEWDDYAGEPYHHYQDPKINLTIFNLLTQAGLKKEYVVIEADNEHSVYMQGTIDEVLPHSDLLAPIDELLNHTLRAGAPMTFINQYDDVITNDLVSEYQYYCHTAGFDFCDVGNPIFP